MFSQLVSYRIALFGAGVAIAAIALTVATLAPTETEATHTTVPLLALDTDSTGNTGSSVGGVDECSGSLEAGDIVDVDIVVKGVPQYDPATMTHGLFAIGGDLLYDRGVVRIIEFNADFLLFQSPGVPFVVTDDLPDEDGRFRFDAADISTSVESGDGVVARVRLEILGAPSTSLRLEKGVSGVDFLLAAGGSSVYDVDDVRSAGLHIGEPCPAAPVGHDAKPLPPGSSSALFVDRTATGYGPSETLLPDDWSFVAVGSPERLLVRVSSGTRTWEIDMTAAEGESLAAGSYERMQNAPCNHRLEPGLGIRSGPDFCRYTAGPFVIHEIEFEPDGQPSVLAVSLTKGLFTPSFWGELRYNSDIPFKAIELHPVNGLDFGQQPVGTSSEPLEAQVRNTGTLPLSIGDIELYGQDPTEFAITDEDCPETLSPGNRCSVWITFSPTGRGHKIMFLRVRDDTPRGERSIILGGEGTEAFLWLPVQSFSGGEVHIGATSPTAPVSIESFGLAPLIVSRFEISGQNPGDFVVAPGDCLSGPIERFETCNFNVSFRPKGLGDRYAVVLIHSNSDNCCPREFYLHGKGLPQLTPRPTRTPVGATAGPTSTATPTPTVDAATQTPTETGPARTPRPTRTPLRAIR